MQPYSPSSQDSLERRLGASDMLTVAQVAERLGVSLVEIEDQVERGLAFAVGSGKPELKLPIWQFDAPLRTVIAQLRRELDAASGWALLTFLETPLGALEGRTPRSALDQGDVERVLIAARYLD